MPEKAAAVRVPTSHESVLQQSLKGDCINVRRYLEHDRCGGLMTNTLRASGGTVISLLLRKLAAPLKESENLRSKRRISKREKRKRLLFAHMG